MDEIVTLKKNKEFKRIYFRGKSCVSSVIVTYAIKNRKNITRVGITTSKKVGNAVTRNRARRVILAAYRELLPDVKSGFDIVFVARARTPLVKTQNILNYMKKHLEKLNVVWYFMITYFMYNM